MSKRALKKYLEDLDKNQLTEQILDLYDRFKDVKTFYDFAFNPKEDKVLSDFKTRVHREYFPPGKRKPKARPSIAQKRIKQFINLEMDPMSLLDAMLFAIETAQRFSSKREKNNEAFFKSFYNSFHQAVNYSKYHGVITNVSDRLQAIAAEAKNQNWSNSSNFIEVLEDQNIK